jgi:hypothetical protein
MDVIGRPYGEILQEKDRVGISATAGVIGASGVFFQHIK